MEYFLLECKFSDVSRKRLRDDDESDKMRLVEKVLSSVLPGIDIFSPDFDISALVTSRLIAPHHHQQQQQQQQDGFFIDDKQNLILSLPDKPTALRLVHSAWNNACVLFRCYHEPSFLTDMDKLYATQPSNYTEADYTKLGLVYAVLSVGALFAAGDRSMFEASESGEGYKYFCSAQKLVDTLEVKDVRTVQAIVMMTMFLQCSARLSTCYTYIGAALRAALGLGLHRDVHAGFNPVEQEIRKRVFWTVRKMDVYLNAMLGMPRGLDDNDFDQTLPRDLDDLDIVENGYKRQEKVLNTVTRTTISNAHTRLLEILSHVMRDIYPVKNGKSGGSSSYKVICGETDKIAQELSSWKDSLPPELKPGATLSNEFVKGNRLLTLCFCYVQIVLYRPFIHYCSPQFSTMSGRNKGVEFAKRCVTVARRAMYVANDMVAREILNGAYWFTTYAIFFAVAILLYFVHENSENSEVHGILMDAEMGKRALQKIKASSASASRTYELLNRMFDQLNSKTLTIRKDNGVFAPLPHADVLLQTHGAGGLIKDSDMNTAIDPLQSIMENGFIDTMNPESINVTSDSLPQPISPQSSTHESRQNGGSQSPYDGDFYIPGFMDQVDSLFGRFVPPYMMQQQKRQESDENEVVNGSVDPVYEHKNNAHGANFDISTLYSEQELNEFMSQNTALTGLNNFSHESAMYSPIA